MKLFEFEGKRIFKEYGIPVPAGRLLNFPNAGENVSAPAVLKAQVLVGGRGKAGGIKIWDGCENLGHVLETLFSKDIKGEKVKAVLVEQKVEILKEYYLSITFKGSKATPVIIASAAGGVDIEKVAKETPEKILTIPIDPMVGPRGYHIKYIAKQLDHAEHRELGKFILKLYSIFKNTDATLVEINPLVMTPDGLVALDAKVLLDDKAAYRRKELFKNIIEKREGLLGKDLGVEKEDNTITYVPLSGTVGLISDGAGTGMLTLDLIKDAGGEAANFCEMGGITNPDVMYTALERVMANPKVEGLLIVLIGGFNRMDEMAEGIIKYQKERGIKVPMAVRMCGTMEDEGTRRMKEAGLPTYVSLLEAVEKIVKLTGGK